MDPALDGDAPTIADEVNKVAALIKSLPQRYDAAFPVAELADHPKNPKEHDIGAISESMERNGFYGALLVQDWPDTPHYILAGHGRKDTLLSYGALTVPVLLIECDPRTALRVLLSDNRTSQLGGFNDNILLQTTVDLLLSGDLAGTGYTPGDVDDLRALTSPIEFGQITENEGEAAALAFKAKEAIIIHVSDINQTATVREAIGALLRDNPEWTAKIFSRQ